MTNKAMLIGGFPNGVGFLVANAYGATPDQAFVFSTVNMLVLCMLKRLIGPYLKNTRQYAFAEIATQATSGLAAVLMTRLFCKKMIHWQQALASSVICDAAFIYAIPLFMKPMPLQPLSDMMNG
jgi:hypothetical protein